MDFDALAACWWVALEAADSALRAAVRTLGSGEAGERGRRLAEERARTGSLLGGLAREERVQSPLVGWLAGAGPTKRMLGLPEDVKACVFALEGVLTTSARLHAAAWAETFDPFLLERAERGHLQFISFDRHVEYELQISGKPRLAGIRAFLASRGISLPEGRPDDPPGAETVHGLANRKNERLHRHLEREGVRAYAGSRCYLEAARMLGIRCAVVSASAHAEEILERAGLDHLIEERVDADTIEEEHLSAEPAPDTLLAACRHLRVDPHEAAAFETTPAGVAAARAADVRLAIAVDHDGLTRALRASDADLVINELTQLLGRTRPLGDGAGRTAQPARS